MSNLAILVFSAVLIVGLAAFGALSLGYLAWDWIDDQRAKARRKAGVR